MKVKGYNHYVEAIFYNLSKDLRSPTTTTIFKLLGPFDFAHGQKRRLLRCVGCVVVHSGCVLSFGEVRRVRSGVKWVCIGFLRGA